jgi:hypothetical protein
MRYAFRDVFKINSIITNIEGMHEGSEEIIFTFSTGDKYSMFHDQEGNESVELLDVVGDYKDLLNSPLLKAEKIIKEGGDKDDDYTFTWTFYKFATKNGYVDLRWYGSSNGYYSEGVYIYHIKDE